jgi:pimeloyl-ACP methyl ester carboxylesterase
VFVHGSFGWGLDTFSGQRDLADRYQIHLLDRAGYGDSPAADQVGWPTDMHDVADILGALGPAHLVGQSYGGVVALLAAGLRPEGVRSLARRAGWIDGHGRLRRCLGRHRHEPGSSEADSWTASWSERDWAAAESSRLERTPVDAPVAYDVLAGLAVPKVVVVGGWPADLAASRTAGLAFRAVADTIGARIGADLVVFDRSTHNPQLQQPDEFNDLLRRVWA